MLSSWHSAVIFFLRSSDGTKIVVLQFGRVGIEEVQCFMETGERDLQRLKSKSGSCGSLRCYHTESLQDRSEIFDREQGPEWVK